jgi:hypothetical protein
MHLLAGSRAEEHGVGCTCEVCREKSWKARRLRWVVVE